MELTTELKTALWQIANLAMDCHDNKLNGEQFEQAALNALKQVKNIAYEPVLASEANCALKQIETTMIEASKCKAKFSMKYVDSDNFTVPIEVTKSRIDNILGDISVETLRIEIAHCG